MAYRSRGQTARKKAYKKKYTRSAPRGYDPTMGGPKAMSSLRTNSSRNLAPLRTGGYYGTNQQVKSSKPELKVIDTQVNLTGGVGDNTVNTTILPVSQVILLNGVAQGNDFNTRIGRRFRMKSIQVRAFCGIGATPTAAVLRVMVVIDYQANGTAVTKAMLLATGGTGAADVTSPMNLDNRSRFKIIWDEFITFSPNGQTEFLWEDWKALRGMEVTNQSINADIAGIATGSIYLVVFSSIPNGGTPATAPTFQALFRVRFWDD